MTPSLAYNDILAVIFRQTVLKLSVKLFETLNGLDNATLKEVSKNVSIFLDHLHSKEHESYVLNAIDFRSLWADSEKFQGDFLLSHDLLSKLFLNNENHALDAFDSVVVRKASQGSMTQGLISNQTSDAIDQVRIHQTASAVPQQKTLFLSRSS